MISVRWWNAGAYYAVSLSQALQEQGHRVTVIGREASPPIRKGRQRRLPTYGAVDLESLNPWVALQNLRRIYHYAAGRSVDLFHAHRPEDHLYAALVKRRYGLAIPLVRTVSDVRSPRRNPFNRWLHGAVTDFFIFSCKASYERYQRMWPVFSDRSVIIYSAVDTRFFTPRTGRLSLRRRLHPSGGEIVIGMIGRLSPVKDPYTFLRAAAQAARLMPEARFLISGEEVEISVAGLQRLAEELGVASRVTFLDKQNDVRDVIRALDIGVVASRGSEAVCRIAVEYMAMGVPQIVTDVNVLPELIVDGQNGFVVPRQDPEAMAQKMVFLARQAALRKRMRRHARKMAEQKFSLSVLAKQTLEIYHRVLDLS